MLQLHAEKCLKVRMPEDKARGFRAFNMWMVGMALLLWGTMCKLSIHRRMRSSLIIPLYGCVPGDTACQLIKLHLCWEKVNDDTPCNDWSTACNNRFKYWIESRGWSLANLYIIYYGNWSISACPIHVVQYSNYKKVYVANHSPPPPQHTLFLDQCLKCNNLWYSML